MTDTQDQDYTLVPPPELVQQWFESASKDGADWPRKVAATAAQWGADAELEACCTYMQHEDFHGFATELRAARRPKPPSLKEIALDCVKRFEAGQDKLGDLDIIRRALEQLND